MNRSSESREEPSTVRYGETRGLRVCLVAGQFPPTIGGEERHAKLLGSALVRCGHEVCVLTQSIAGEPSEETLEGVRVVRAIRFLRRRRLIGLSYAASVALFLLRTRKHFNIVQTTYLYWETVIAALLKPVLNGRLVVRIVISGAAGDIACFRALRLWPLPESWRQRALESFTALVVRRADVFITLTTRGREELIGLGAHPARCHVVSNGIESARFASMTRSLKKREIPQLLCVGRLTRQKGLDVLLCALPILQAMMGRVAVTILGEGPEEQALAVLAGQLGVADAVQFRGAVSDVTPYLATTDVFVFPSRYEGLPLALLEAMAAGLPVVASAVPGNTDLIRDGVEGLLIPPDDPGALAIAIARVLQEPGLAPRLGAAGRSLVVNRYDVKIMLDQTIRAYRRALEPRI